MRLRSCKKLCIARPESQAAVLSVRLAGMIWKKNDYEMPSNYYWSDSSAGIGRIRGFKATSCFHCQQGFPKFLILQNLQNTS